MQALRAAELADTFRDVQLDANEVGTFHAFRGGTGGEKIDYVMRSVESVTEGAAILGEPGPNGRWVSDHHPVSATVRMR